MVYLRKMVEGYVTGRLMRGRVPVLKESVPGAPCKKRMCMGILFLQVDLERAGKERY